MAWLSTSSAKGGSQKMILEAANRFLLEDEWVYE